MSDHYFSEKPTVAHAKREFVVTLRNFTLKFMSDAGVFSKDSVDFGSRLLLETMQISEDDHVLDVGCGYGVIGITAAKLARQGRVTMVDVNGRALHLADLNVSINHLENVIVQQSDLFSGLEKQRFTKIVSNPPIRAGKQVVHALFEQSVTWLTNQGELWIVIQKKQGAPSAIKKLEELFEVVEVVKREKGYHIIRSRNPK
jgi:16S rRNA (guanine1207-N2)-methyltransferase